MECVTSARAAILLNGSSTKEFCFERGLRQGDPLSPFLFILVTEVLHLMMVKAGELDVIKGIHGIIPEQETSHLQFADDTILFLKAKEEVILNVKAMLCCFELFSGLSINFNKSSIVGFGVKEEFLYRMAASCKCKIEELHFKYLGIPLGADPRRIAT